MWAKSGLSGYIAPIAHMGPIWELYGQSGQMCSSDSSKGLALMGYQLKVSWENVIMVLNNRWNNISTETALTGLIYPS